MGSNPTIAVWMFVFFIATNHPIHHHNTSDWWGSAMGCTPIEIKHGLSILSVPKIQQTHEIQEKNCQ
jgi:hypothetical protein